MSNEKSQGEAREVEVKDLRKVLQHFNEDLGQYINSEERYKLGRVLTIIDAAISDQEQRKAIKDLVNNEWWSMNARSTDYMGKMVDPYSDIRGLCESLGFELYPAQEYALTENTGTESQHNYIVERYKNVLTTRK